MTKPSPLLPAELRQRVVRSLDRYSDDAVPPEILEADIAAAAIVFAVWPAEDGIS